LGLGIYQDRPGRFNLGGGDITLGLARADLTFAYSVCFNGFFNPFQVDLRSFKFGFCSLQPR